MWGPCWAIWGLSWGYVGSFGGLCVGLMEVCGGKNSPQPKTFRLRFILGAFLGLCGAHVGGIRWVFWWAIGGSMEVSER